MSKWAMNILRNKNSTWPIMWCSMHPRGAHFILFYFSVRAKKKPPALLGDWEPAGKFLLTRNLNPKQGLSNDKRKRLQRRWRWIDSPPGWRWRGRDRRSRGKRPLERASAPAWPRTWPREEKIFCCYINLFLFLL